jgi:uncharacterized membrane-anchored protein
LIHSIGAKTIYRQAKNAGSSISLWAWVLFVAICLALFSGQHGQNAWWYWMLIPAFSLMGGGVAEMVRVKQSRRSIAF